MRVGSLLALLGFCLAFPPTSVAQIDERIPSRVFTPREGLPGSGVSSIAQTTDGLLWVGTGGGLAYFDGVRFNEVALPDTLSRSGIMALEPAPDGSLWVATARHGVWNLAADFELRSLEELAGDSYGTILTSGGTTYFLSRTAIWAVDQGSHGARQLSQGYPITAPVLARASEDAVGAGPISAAIAQDGRMVLLDAVQGPVFHQEANAVSFASGVSGSWTSIAADSDGGLWALEIDRGLFRLDDDLVPHLVLELDRSRHLLIHEGIGYITTRAGVVRFDLAAGRLLDILDERAGLPTSDSDVSYIDHEGSLWIGTRAGLIQVPRPRVRHIEYVDGQRLLNVSFLAPVAEGELWGASYLGGLVRLAPTRGIERPFASNRWTTVTETASGQVVAIGNAGVATLAGGAWQESVPLATSVRGVGGPANGAYVWKDHGAFLYSTIDGSALSIYEWPVEDRSYHAIGTAPGGDSVIRARDLVLRARVDPARSALQIDTLARLADVDESPGRFLVMDPLGAVWIGFWDKGLVRVHGGVATTMLPDEHIGQMRLSGDTLLYASSRNGLFAFDVRTQDLLFALHEDDGLLAATTAGAAVVDGTLFIAHPTGVTTIPLDAIGRTLPAPPRVHLAPATPVIRTGDALPRLERDVSFRFFATSYLNAGAISYEYRLADAPWAPAGGNTLQFHRLRGGTHALQVRARFKDADPGPAASYAFIVPTAYHETVWFRALLPFLLLFLGGIIWKARVRSLKRGEIELKELVDERTRRLAEAMKTTEKQAHQLRQHDELKTRFFTNISHEFRTPLTLVRGLVDDVISERHGPLSPDAEARLAIVSENADRLATLVEDLLQLSRLEAGKAPLNPRSADLVAAIQSVVDAHVPAAERKDVRLSASHEVEIYPTLFDVRAIDRLVANLLSNAIKHTPAGGTVEVLLSVKEAPAGVGIVVQDDGSGIPADLLPHIFDRFVLGEEEAGSSGIGLALVKELVALHGGSVQVDSEVGTGSRFTVFLPLVREDPPGDGFPGEGRQPGLVEPSIDQGLITSGSTASPDADAILLVEDNPQIRAYVASHLAGRFRIFEAGDGAEALLLAREVMPTLIISDVMMPGMSGDELCRQLRADEALAHIPVILLTARAGGPAVIEGLRSGADSYVEKPFHMDVLLARVDRLIASRKALRDGFGRNMVIESLELEIDSSEEELMKRIFEVMEARVEDATFGVADLAAEAGSSTRHLRRRVKEATGHSPASLLRRYRLALAERLISAGAVSSSEASYRVGYGSPSAFALQFKKQFGMSPSDYAAARAAADVEGAE